MQIFIVLCSLLLVVFSANYLVEGATVIAKKLHVSEFVIGMLIVGFGTSLPELVVSLVGAVEGNTDVSLGNIIGSNIFNTGLILGLSALILPITVSEVVSRRDIPFMLMSTALFLLFGLSGGGINRLEGGLLLAWFVLYVVYLFNTDGTDTKTEDIKSGLLFESLPGAIALSIGATIGLIAGGKLFVDSAVKLGGELGISDKVIGITILAFGTSLPELATCLAAIVKKRSMMALGDIVGSNIFNMLLIIGSAALVRPLGFQNINVIDIIAFSLCMLIVLISQHTTHKGIITRFDGACLLGLFIAYLVMLFQLG